MPRSKFVVVFVLIYASSLLGQHSSSTSTSGGHSGGGSSSGSGSSGGGGSSHTSSSGGSHGGSSSHSAGSSGHHTTSYSSSNTKGSGSKGSANTSSHAESALVSRSFTEGGLSEDVFHHSYFIQTIDEKGKPVLISPTTALEVREMEKSGKSPAEIGKFVRDRGFPVRPIRTPDRPEKRGFLSFLRHRNLKPEHVAESDLKMRVCLHPGCPVCAMGFHVGRGGTCVASTLLAPNYCASGSYWGGASCRALGAHTCLHAHLPELEAAKRKMEEAKRNMDAACSRDAASHDCSELNFLYQQAVGEYHLQQERQRQAYRNCLLGNSFASLDPSLDLFQ